MLDRKAIYGRFASCYREYKPARLARILEVADQTVYDWESGKTMIARDRLKAAVDRFSLHWDWLIDGKSPKRRRTPSGGTGELDRHDVNRRLLSLFPGLSQAKLGAIFGVHQTAVYKWCTDKSFVSWDALEFAVINKGVTWDWLLEGTSESPTWA